MIKLPLFGLVKGTHEFFLKLQNQCVSKDTIYSAFNLDHHSMNATYKGGFVYFPCFFVLMVQVFLSQVIGLS
jgi:hypothetical protein